MTTSNENSSGKPEHKPKQEHAHQNRHLQKSPASAGATTKAVGLGALALAAAALTNYGLARRAEWRDPPEGEYIQVDGVRLHYIERGTGPAIVLLHGNGTMARDFVISGLFDLLATDHRVIAFDRPGFGFSERPRSRIWGADEQAALLQKALVKLGVRRPLIVGHSWGTLVALAMAFRNQAETAGLVLLSGYYFPTFRSDVALALWPAVPLFGDVLRYTLSPLLGRMAAPTVFRKLFEPAPITARFADEFPTELSLRPWQIRATAADAALMIPAARSMADRYPELSLPVAIVAGRGDKVVDFDGQPARLDRALPSSRLREFPDAGHMVHHTEPDQVASIIREMAGARHQAVHSPAQATHADEPTHPDEQGARALAR